MPLAGVLASLILFGCGLEEEIEEPEEECVCVILKKVDLTSLPR